MLALFVRQENIQTSYYWIHPKKLKKFLLLKFLSEEVPLRFVLFNFMFYFDIIIGSFLYGLLFYLQTLYTINISFCTLVISLTLNLLPIIGFVILELIEQRLFRIHKK